MSTLLLSLSLAACGGSKSTASQATTPKSADDPSCPVVVPGTSVTVEDAPSGAALVFVTTGDVAEVRKRAAAWAAMHDEHHGAMGPLPDGTDDGGHAHDHGHAHHGDHGGGDHAAHGAHGGGTHAGHAGGMVAVHSKATASDIEGGAKILFVAGAADVAKLQGELRMHAQHLASGTCKMEHP